MLQKIPLTKKSLKTRGIESSYQIWLNQKKQQDQNIWNFQSKYWVINNKIYDLTDFIIKHPGGQHWIKYTQGKEITQQYMVHHLNIQRANQILKKYYIKDCDNIVPTRFTFQDSGLYQIVKKRIFSKYTIQQLQNTSKTQKIGIILFLAWIFSFVMTGIYQSYIWAVICGFLIISVTGVAHNFIHMKPNIFKYLYLVTGFIPKQWQIMHCLSHHQYTNTLLDYQIQAYQPLVYFLKILPQNNLFKIILLQIVYILTIPLNILFKLLIVPITKRCKPEWLYLVLLTQILFLYFITSDINISLNLFLTIHCFFGFIFPIFTSGGHRVQNLWTEGQKQIKDFGQHSLQTCNDIQPQLKGGFLSFIIVSGFNIHAIHHMFPTIDNQNLWKVDDILKEVCQEKGLKKKSLSLFQTIISMFKYHLRKHKNKEA